MTPRPFTSVPGHASSDGVASQLSPLQILDEAQAGRVVLQDYRPLAESLEWELGQQYWLDRGSQAFIGDPEPVPFVVNNDGNLSIRAAELFFTSLVEAEKVGKLPEDIFVLELGIGVGLFARYFLNWFRHLSDQSGKDYYDRLIYVAADRSAKMLRDAGRHGIFLSHAGRYRLRVADALCPQLTLLEDADIRAQGPRPFRAVFLNYLLDCLPPTVVKVEGNQVQQLHVRTTIGKETEWRASLDMTQDELLQLAASNDPADRRELMAVYHLLLSEYQYRPVEVQQVHYADFVVELARGVAGRPVLHNHGAIRCLEALLGLLADGGFILVNDYGQTEEIVAPAFEHQRFSQATGVGVNFPLLRSYFTSSKRAAWVEPAKDDASLHSRMLTHQPFPRLASRFEECFGEAARQWLDEPAQQARELVKAGRLQAALELYGEALARQPYSWVLMNEVAQLLAFALHNPKAGLEMARLAVEHNLACSAEVWNTQGDCLYLLGRMTDARRAFERALEINPDDVRARFNMAFVHVVAHEYPEALVRIAEALALDRTGAYRERLLQKQAEVLGLLEQQNQRRYLGEVNRVAGAGTIGTPLRSTANPGPGRGAIPPGMEAQLPDVRR